MSVLEHKDDLNPWTVFSSQRILVTLTEKSQDIQLRVETKSALIETKYRNLKIWL